MGNVIFNGVSSLDLDIQVEHQPKYVMPEREYESISVPGRNGNLFIDKGSYKNVNQPYDIAIANLEKDYTGMVQLVARWLHPKAGYCRLEDSYSPDYYRLAMFNDSVDFENVQAHGGRATIEFDCKPQRFLKSGEKAIILTTSSIIKNPTLEASSPIITIKGGTGSGKLQVGTYVVSISNLRNNLIIDSELQDAYWGTVNRNSDVSLGNGFPKIVPGPVFVSFSGSITSVEVIPKWWTV